MVRLMSVVCGGAERKDLISTLNKTSASENVNGPELDFGAISGLGICMELRSCPHSYPITTPMDELGALGRVWRETDEDTADRATLIRDILKGQYESPVRIVAFNTAEGWCRDVTVEIAKEVRQRVVGDDDVLASVLGFIDANRH
jgi:hypothetical protein